MYGGEHMDLSILKPIIAAEGQKLIDEVLMPELAALVDAKILDPLLKQIAQSLLPIIKNAADAEIQALLK